MKFSSAEIQKKRPIIFLLVLFFILWITGSYFDGLGPVSEFKTNEFRIVEIKKGEGVWSIAKKLKEKGVIKSRWVFIIEALRTGLYNKIKPGEYAFYTHQSLGEILRILVEGRVLSHKITIPEGLTLWQIAEILDRNNICKKEEFLKLAQDPQVAKKFGLPGPTLEGYLYPDTYYFHKYTHPGVIIKTMVDNFWKHWDKYKDIANKKGMFLKEVITLASIVEKEAKEHPHSPFAQHKLAIAYFNLGKFQEAKEAFKRVLKIDPYHFEAMINLGIILAQEGEIEEAKKAFTFTLKFYPKSVEAWINLGLVEFQLGNLEEAEKCYKKAIELKKDDPAAWVNLSTILIEKGQYKEAISALEKAKSLAPQMGTIYNNLAVAYYHLGNIEEAKKNIAQAKSLGYSVNPEFERLVNEDS